MSNIPLARAELELAAYYLENPSMTVLEGRAAALKHVKRALENMYRERPVRKAPVQSKRVTPCLEREVRAHALLNPSMPLALLAHRFNINPGRVSEILNERKDHA
jgi:hypothetical protein